MKTKMQELQKLVRIAQLHERSLHESLVILKKMMPLNEDKVSHFDRESRVEWEILTTRFSKLQDLMAQKMITDFLEVTGEDTKGLFFIDKLNLLEKLGIIKSMYQWKDFRDLRNHLSHEYPDRPDLMADYLNQTYDAVPELLRCLHAMVACLEKITEEL